MASASNTVSFAVGAAGLNAFSALLGGFTQPAIGATVDAVIKSGSWLVRGQSIFVENGGYYRVEQTILRSDGSVTATLTNLNVIGNAAPGAAVPIGACAPAGEPGGVTSGVASVFGRTGAVVAQIGDYTAAQVGAAVVTRTIYTEGLATGGGDLSVDRTITVTPGLASDIQPLGGAAAAGATGKAADAGHVHPYPTSAQILGNGAWQGQPLGWDTGTSSWLETGVLAPQVVVAPDSGGIEIRGVAADLSTPAPVIISVQGPSTLSSVLSASVGGESGDSATLGFFVTDPGVERQTVTGSTVAAKVDSLIAALGDATGYGLIHDTSTTGDNANTVDSRAITSSALVTTAAINLTDEALTRLVVVVVARDTSSNFYKYKYSQEYTRVGAGSAVLLDGGETAIVANNISGFVGASLVISANQVLVKVGGSDSVHANVHTEVYVDTIAISAAT